MTHRLLLIVMLLCLVLMVACASPTPAPTTVPTQAPVPTVAPTQVPATTAAPTKASVATAAPTLAPTVAPTQAPTQVPVTTVAPTKAAVATTAPTQVPASTLAPTVVPTSKPGTFGRAEVNAIFPPGRGQDLVFNSCVNCHNWVPIVVVQFTKEEWERNNRDHRMGRVSLSDEDWAILSKYLIENFNPSKPVPTNIPQDLLDQWTSY